jgi:hypothetical protein
VITPFFLLAHLGQSAPPADFVPDSGWPHPNSAEHYESWFGGQLRAMQEPPLATPDQLGGFRERFRLLVLPTFHPAHSYRLDVGRNGSITVRWVRLDGRGGYAPGKVARQGSRQLRPGEVRRFRSALAASKLGSVPREIANIGRFGEPLSLCVDGTQFVLEHLTANGRDYVVRECGIDEVPIRKLARIVFGFTPS